jgi:hypothetical protein
MQMSQSVNEASGFQFHHFGLIVTGEGEEEFLPELFREFMRGRSCTFEVLRKIGQRSPLTSRKKILKMVGTGKKIASKDETEIGLPARAYLKKGGSRFIILIDDLEGDRISQAEQVFQRYRDALDSIVGGLEYRASVHFLVNMLEAYYFADPITVNSVLGTSIQNPTKNVEKIPHPKNMLKKLKPGFDEKADGKKILSKLDMVLVLNTIDTCVWLRSLFAWCTMAIRKPATTMFQLDRGAYAILTGRQLAGLKLVRDGKPKCI